MGLPEIKISFTKKVKTFIARSGRGLLVMILKDNTNEQTITPYTEYGEVDPAAWSEKNLDYIRMAFQGEPSRVVCVRAVQEEGTVKISETLQLFEALNTDYFVIPEYETVFGEVIKNWIKEQRDKGKKVKSVLPGFAADYEGIINYVTDNVSVLWPDETKIKTYAAAEYCCRIAGILAGLPLTRSSTYYVLDEIVDIEQSADPDRDIDDGKLVLVFDGEKYKIGRGVTSLKTVSESAPEDFKKIKIIEGADLIRNDIYATFADHFVGRLNNSYDNKQNFVGACCEYLAGLYDTVLDREEENYVEIDRAANEAYLVAQGRDTSEMSAQRIAEANTGATLFLTGKIRFLDAMEDLQMKLSM